MKYDAVSDKNKATCCCICIEDFKNEQIVRQSPCGHIFHDKCIMEWIKTKIESPDCPQCRKEI